MVNIDRDRLGMLPEDNARPGEYRTAEALFDRIESGAQHVLSRRRYR